MSDHHPAGQHGAYLLHGPLTREEQELLERQTAEDEQRKKEDGFKERQIAATEAANNLAFRNLLLTFASGLIALVACMATWYQGRLTRRNLDTANDTLRQIKADSEASSRQFQVQLGHFDAGLGRSDQLAIHAAEQATESKKLSQISDRQAATARRSLDVSITNFQQEQRAWLAPCGAAMNQFEAGKPIQASVRICNTGRTPALKVQTDNLFATKYTIVSGPDQVDLAASSFVPANPVAPNGSFSIYLGAYNPLSTDVGRIKVEEEINKRFELIYSGKQVLYYFGTLRYEDTFGVPHYMNYCFYLLDPKIKSLATCSQFNDLN